MRIPLGMALALFAVALPNESAQASALTVDSAPEVTFDIPKGWVACDAATSLSFRGGEDRPIIADCSMKSLSRV